MPAAIAILLLLFSTVSRAAEELEVSCLGLSNAKHALIFLHGMDSSRPSQQELSNRAILERIADSLNVRIALPRAANMCPTQPNSIC